MDSGRKAGLAVFVVLVALIGIAAYGLLVVVLGVVAISLLGNRALGLGL